MTVYLYIYIYIRVVVDIVCYNIERGIIFMYIVGGFWFFVSQCHSSLKSNG